MKKVYIETFGCQMNVSDTERAATNLASNGFKIVDREESADVVVINTCSVREKAEHKLYTRIGQIRKAHQTEKMIGVMGCVAQLEGETLFAKIEGLDFVLGTKAVGRLNQAIETVSDAREPYIDIAEREDNYNWNVSLEQRISNHVAFLPIIEGCNKFCTYCIVPFSRGREKSLAPNLIIQQVNSLISEGVKEVHLIGQNVNSYRPKTEAGLELFHGATPFSRLLRAVAATGIERIKFTTSFPRDFHPDIVKALDEHENLCNWVHLPVQSGSDRILKLMRRGHSVDDYRRRIDAIRDSKRNISLTTDIIVGFPGETDEDFEQSFELYQYCQYDSAYLFKYSPRLGTPATRIEGQVDSETIDRRFMKLDQLQKSYTKSKLRSLVGTKHLVLAEKKSVKDPEYFSGHSTCHRVVNFKTSNPTLGKVYEVCVTSSSSNSLIGYC